MSLRLLSPTEWLIALKTYIVYANVAENVVTRFDLPKEQPVKTEEEDGQPAVQLPPGIQNLAVSPDNNYVAVSTREKYLYIFQLEARSPFRLTQVAKFILTRVSNRLRFSADSRKLLIADKTGDVYLWPFLENDTLQPVCGHLSMVMDVLFTDNESALVTCDRDEKIRVTSYPDTHNLIAYCMGHSEYVAQVELVPHNHSWVVSISGDQTVRVWDLNDGREVLQLPLTGPGAYMTCWKSGENSSIIACGIYQSEMLQVFEVQSNSTGEALKMKTMKQVQLSTHTAFKDLQNFHGEIVTLALNKTEEKFTPQLERFEYDPEERTYISQDLKTINSLLCAELTDLDLDTEDRDDVAVLFKKRVNNIMHYHERKRKRIEEKSK